jgi:hypothetical protein
MGIRVVERRDPRAMSLLAMDGSGRRQFSAPRGNECGAEALPPPHFRTTFGECLNDTLGRNVVNHKMYFVL